ncbi:hypothetical protein ABFS82_14G108900 [Erythranthe guttata]
MAGSKRSHATNSSSDSMLLKQRTAWELKKKPAEQRLLNLTKQKKNGDSVSTDKAIVCSFGLQNPTMDRAHSMQGNLSPDFPSFVKPMQMSHVITKQRLTLPKLFCDAHLPKEDGIIVLLDENDQLHDTKYMMEVRDRYALTFGWRSFSTANKLLEGDVLVFQLVEPWKFKVYIVRDTIFTKVDGPNQDHFHRKLIEAVKTEPEEENSDPIKTTGDKYRKYLAQKKETLNSKRTASDFKKNVVEALIDLTNQKKNGDSVTAITNRPIICSCMDRAHAIQANLSPNFPNFLKTMRKSYVTGKFWLILPKPFCDAHILKKDGWIVLLDENDRGHNTKYLVGSHTLSSGWKSFSVAHELREGDVLVFQLIESCKFKIYIAKATTTLPNQDHFHREPVEAVKPEPEEENTDNTGTRRDKYLEYRSKKKEKIIPISKPNGIRSSECSLVSFKDIKGFKDFSIYVDARILDSEIPTHCKAKYYELCKSQNMFLHENIVQGLNGKLAVEMISELIKIADSIRAADSKTGTDRMEGWDKTLKAFEDLGMVVGFLRVRIRKLIRVFREYGADIELMRIERDEAEEERIALNVKLWRVENRIGQIDDEIDALRSVKNEGVGPVFKKIACAPW